MTDITRVAARHMGRPLLLTPQAAEYYLARIQAMDPGFAARPSRVQALVRRLSGTARPVMAMEDDEPAREVPMGELGAYSPLYAGEVEEGGFCWSLKDGIALIECDTPLLDRGTVFCGSVWHGYDTLLTAMREAHADARVKAVFLRADSPGGVVSGGLNVLADWMRANRAAAGGKPIWVYADMACSAMYWIAASGDRIVAPDVGQLGSIGAVMVHESVAGWLEKTGIAITSIEFPEGGLKTEGAWWKALSEEGRAALQADISQCGRNFLAAVTAGRPNLTSDVLLATRAECYLAQHDDAARSALAIGFCDEIMGEEAAFNSLVATVSGAAPEPSQTSAQAAGAQPKEQAMKQANTPSAGAPANRHDRRAAASRARAEGDQPKDDDETDKEKDETEAESETDKDEDEDKEKDKTEAQRIASSPEAQAHPALANAAIVQNLTYAQFKGMAGVAPGKGKLAQHLSGGQRLGADAPQGGGSPASGLKSRAQARAEKSNRR